MVYNITIYDFTVNQLLKYLENTGIPKTAKLYNFCGYDKHAVEILERGEISAFEPIFLLDEDNGITTVHDFEGKEEPLTVEDMYSICDKSYFIERDVEDGYVYQSYDSIVCNKEYVVLM